MKRSAGLFIAIMLILGFQHTLTAQTVSDTIGIDEVVVTANRVEVARTSTPVSITVIGQKEIEQQEEANILPVVAKRTPSLFVSEIGVAGYPLGNGSSGQLTIRGVGGSPNARIMMMVDGQPQFMGVFGHPLPNFHMASNVEKVEVIRGPSSIIYGSNAMGGVINVISKKSDKQGLSGKGFVSYGSFNTLKTGISAGYKRNGFSSGVSFNHVQTDGHRDSSEFSISNIHAYLGYKLNSNWSFRTGATVADYSFMDPGSEFVSQPLTFMGDITRSMVTASLTNQYDRTEGGVYAFYNAGEHDFSDGWKSTDRNAGVNVYQSLKLWTGGLVTGGVDLKTYGAAGTLSNIGPPTFALSTYEDTTLTVSEQAAYLLAEQSIGEFLDLSAGSRYEMHSLYGGEWVPQIGLSVHPLKGTTVKGVISKGFRSPTLMDLYLFPPANPDLGPERLWNYEVSASQRVGAKAILSITGYVMEGSNLIVTQPNPNAPPPVIRVNGGEFNNWGIEFEGSYMPGQNVGIDVSYSYLNADQKLLFAPEHQLFTGLNYRVGDLVFALNMKYINDLYTLIDNETPGNDILESYLLLDSKISYKPMEMIQVYIAGKNLLNEEYQTVYGYTMPGIHLMTGLAVEF